MVLSFLVLGDRETRVLAQAGGSSRDISNHSFSFYFKLNWDFFPGHVIRAQGPPSLDWASCGKQRG